MKLPDWAERALELFRPQILHGTDEPDPEHVRKFEQVEARFRKHWSEQLKPEKWRVPKQHPRYATLAAGSKYVPCDIVRQTILEIAIESACDLGAGKRPQQTINAIKELDDLNCKISEEAEHLAALFRQRKQLKSDFQLTDQSMTDQNYPDPFWIFGALQLASQHEKFRTWAHVYRTQIAAFLSTTRKPRANPDWADLLDQASYRESKSITGRDLGDIAVIGSTTNKTEWSQVALQLIGRLDDSISYGLPAGFFLKCLTNAQLASLASVAFNADSEGKINAEQIRKLKTAYLARKSKADDSAHAGVVNRARQR